MEFFNIFIFNNVKLRLKKTFYHPNKVVFKVKMLPLYRLYPYRKPRWAEVGQTYIHIRRNCTLWFWQCKNLAVRAKVVKNKATGTPHEVYCIQPSLASDDSVVCCQECFLYTYTGVGLSALLVSTTWAMPEPLHCGTSDRTGSTFSCIYTNHLLIKPIW